MKISKTVFIFILTLSVVSMLNAQIDRQTGSIRGTITDDAGSPLPGVSVTAVGPSLQGKVTDISGGDGTYRLPALPPGIYTITAELTGFQTVNQQGIRVSVGMVLTVNFQLKLSTLSESINVVAVSPTVDVQSNKMSTIVSREVMSRLPLDRSLGNIQAMMPGVVGSNYVHGATSSGDRAYFELDGIGTLDPNVGGNMVSVEFDAMEEVEMVTGALPAQVGLTGGSFVNVITKSGGNTFSGQAQVFYTNEHMANLLFTEEQLSVYQIGKPDFDIYNVNGSGMLGGPIVKDKLWFFGNFGYTDSESPSEFIPTTILGVKYDQYPWPVRRYQGFLKLTSQLRENIRFFTTFVYDRRSQPYYIIGSPSDKTTVEATQEYVSTVTTINANFNWILNPETYLDLRGGFTTRPWEFPMNGDPNAIRYYDAFTGYDWGGNNRGNEIYNRPSQQASARVTHFRDQFLGGNHEFGAGVEIYRGVTERWCWDENPLHWRYYNGNPYYYRGLYGLNGPHPTFGDGWLNFEIASVAKDGAISGGTAYRVSGYLQDSYTIKQRLSINAGVRYDWTRADIPERTHKVTGGIAPQIGEYYLKPKYGINPYEEFVVPGLKNAFTWTTFSPRLGISYDLFGDGKTALKAAFSIYSEFLPGTYFYSIHPHRTMYFTFNWWDLNKNLVPDAPPVDRYDLRDTTPESMRPDRWQKRMGEDIKAPKDYEAVLSIQHELLTDLRVGLQGIYKWKKDIVENVLQDVYGTGRMWYTHELAPDWWIPFNTILPAYGIFPEQQVTVYFMSKNAPSDRQVLVQNSIPEAKKKYIGLELTFDKRLSKGWALGGSLTISQTKDHSTVGQGFGSAFDSANWWVNQYGLSEADRPMVLKLYGTFDLPWRFLASFYYLYSSGSPWQRTDTIYPPAKWAAENNCLAYSYSVNVEPKSSRRYPETNNVDFRLEKEFGIGNTKLGLFLDVYNLLGYTYVNIGQNTGGRWYPSAENTTKGTYTIGYNYGRVASLTGVRTYKASIRFTF